MTGPSSLGAYGAFFTALCLAGCVGGDVVRYTSPTFQSQASGQVAVLPFDNESVDLIAPEMLRGMVAGKLKPHGYDPLPADKIDQDLKAIGITDGGQLRPIPSQKVGAAVGAEGLIYGVVEEFAFLNVGFAVRRVVRLHLRFVAASTGQTLWEDTEEGVTEWLTLKQKEAARAFMEGMVQREVENLLHTPLMPESQEAVRRLFARLPPFSGSAAQSASVK